MRISFLNPDGVHPSEKAALMKVEDAFLKLPWKAYAALDLIDKSAGNMELDLVLVTEDRIVIVELKNWNGAIKSDGKRWFCNDNSRGRSPVELTNLKTKKLADRIRSQLTSAKTPFVDFRIVLCGTVTSLL